MRTSLIAVAALLAGFSGTAPAQQCRKGDAQPSLVSLQSITVTPNNAVINVGDQQQYTAMGHFSDGESCDITDQVGWFSSDTHVATIDSNGEGTGTGETYGLANGLASCRTNITAEGFSGVPTLEESLAPPVTVVSDPVTLIVKTPNDLIVVHIQELRGAAGEAGLSNKIRKTLLKAQQAAGKNNRTTAEYWVGLFNFYVQRAGLSDGVRTYLLGLGHQIQVELFCPNNPKDW